MVIRTSGYSVTLQGGGLFFAVGDPGRAFLETPDGPPPARIGPSDVELSAASLPGVLIRAASIRGLQHRARGTPRQDAFALGHRAVYGQAEQAVAIVCDGVGSLSRSDEAAVFVSRRLAALGAEGMSWPDAFARVNEELRKFVEGELNADTDATARGNGMATTAIAVIVRREADEWLGEAAWVGDSMLWHLSRDGQWTLVTGRQNESAEASYYSSSVSPLPSPDGECTWCGFRISGGALFAMTDGVANPLWWSRDVKRTLADWWQRPPDPFTFAAQVGFARRSHIDDRTVVAIWPDGSDADEDREGEPRTTGSSG